jgi:hypothetical protein
MDSARHGTPSVETFVVSGLANKRINSAPLVECGVMSSCDALMSTRDVEGERVIAGALTFPLESVANELLESSY